MPMPRPRSVIISVPVFRVGPPGHFKNISITTPIASALKKHYT
jgi:hypothetical protein